MAGGTYRWLKPAESPALIPAGEAQCSAGAANRRWPAAPANTPPSVRVARRRADWTVRAQIVHIRPCHGETCAPLRTSCATARDRDLGSNMTLPRHPALLKGALLKTRRGPHCGPRRGPSKSYIRVTVIRVVLPCSVTLPLPVKPPFSGHPSGDPPPLTGSVSGPGVTVVATLLTTLMVPMRFELASP